MAAVVASALLATGGLDLSSAAQGELRLVVSPKVSLSTSPLKITISGLKAGQHVTLSVSSFDSYGATWKSVSTYTAGRPGTLSPASTPSGGPSYTGLDPMGPVDFMSSSSKSEALYSWPSGPQTFELTASSDGEKADLTVQRDLGSFATTPETLGQEGFVGEYFAPVTAPPKRDRPAVLLFGGSEGGMSEWLLAEALAAHGYPTLDLAYFKEPGLPQALEDIPLGYFAKALRWLGSQPGVDPARMWVDGVSRGSEAALLLGVHYPGLVHGVVALVPSDAALCSYPSCAGPAWTFQGKAVPYTRQVDQPHPTDDPAAVIAVARVKGPVFLDCGDEDGLWTSCAYARAIMAELAAAHDPYPHVLMVSQKGGHFSALEVPPYEPGAPELQRADPLVGGTPVGDDLAWAGQWPRFINFLKL